MHPEFAVSQTTLSISITAGHIRGVSIQCRGFEASRLMLQKVLPTTLCTCCTKTCIAAINASVKVCWLDIGASGSFTREECNQQQKTAHEGEGSIRCCTTQEMEHMLVQEACSKFCASLMHKCQ